MPSKSKLNEKRSDIFGNIKYNYNKYLNLGYSFSYDKDLKYSNQDQLSLDLNLNNFYTNISYYSEQHDLPDVENIKNTTKLNFNEENNLKFELSKDLNDNFTEYYNLVYTYVTDCISFDLSFNKIFIEMVVLNLVKVYHFGENHTFHRNRCTEYWQLYEKLKYV